MNESQLIKTIKAHIARGDKAKDKAEQHYIAAGQYLKQLKDDCPDQKTFLEKVEKEIGIGKSRAYELIQIGDGRKTLDEIRADTAKRVAKHEQSCPLANGQNAGDPEASAEAMKAKFADADETVIEVHDGGACRRRRVFYGDGEEEERDIEGANSAPADLWPATVRIRAFLDRAEESVLAARVDDLGGLVCTRDMHEAAEEAARAWNKVAASIRLRVNNGVPPNDDGLDIPESLRRAPKAAAP